MEFINLLVLMSNQKNKSLKRPKGLFFSYEIILLNMLKMNNLTKNRNNMKD